MDPETRGAELTPIEVMLEAAQAFEQIGVDYLIGGSMASSIHGLARSTMDVDIVADLDIRDVDALVDRLGDGWHADRLAIREAVIARRSFNLLHLETMFKVDVFVLARDPWARSQMQRRERLRVGDSDQDLAYFATLEDTVLAKLRWYRMGGEVSDRQWRDVLGMLSLRQNDLDGAYLDRWAEVLHVQDLLQTARQVVNEGDD